MSFLASSIPIAACLRDAPRVPFLVTVSRSPVTLPTYAPAAPDKNPMFLEKRVYQGSSGKVYPLPFIDRIAEEKTDVEWDAVHLENEFIRLMILPQIGGRIHVGQDKTNGYDFFYRQNVIKPALVGLAGPWISGGVEFNWPQHHRPSTFMPADVEIEKHADGSVTVWLSEHEPMNRMKGMHGVCLHPGRSVIELKARVFNRTALPQTFLWWANVATRVHEQYQSFFPPDVSYVADHAKRGMSRFPLCDGSYYGVDYAGRAARGVPPGEVPRQFVPPGGYAPNDLGWYANIPAPTSYMCVGSDGDFFGGYDHRAGAGLVHVADHHIAPGKKQWTWGNHDFGHAWDRNLTDADETGEFAPYIELMAGVYTDNQPDFSFLAPGETKTWSQFWYPIQKIGVPQKANLDAAISLRREGNAVRVGVAVTREFKNARVIVSGRVGVPPAGSGVPPEPSRNQKTSIAPSHINDTRSVPRDAKHGGRDAHPTREQIADLSPATPFIGDFTIHGDIWEADLTVRVVDATGREIISYTPREGTKGEVPPPATEPPQPADIASNEELYLTGLHLDQYRHATRMPETYWREALRRDPGDARCNNALGLWHLRRGEFALAEDHFRKAIARLTLRNPNPYDGEPHYNLGLALRYLGRDDEAYAAFYKSTWNHAWQAAAYHAIAELDCRKCDWAAALTHLDRALRLNADNLRARNLRAIVLRKLGREAEAGAMLRGTLEIDPLDWWARALLGESLRCDTQVRLDLALDFARAGAYGQAIDALKAAAPEPRSGTAPLVGYCLGWLHAQLGDGKAAKVHCHAASKASPDYCFPARLEEIAILEHAMRLNPADGRAPYYLGNLLYDRRRHREAIALWEKAARLDPGFPIVWRNLGIGYFNITGQPAKARAAYDKAFKANHQDARLLFERDQLWKRLGATPARRSKELEKRPDLVSQRDDLSVEICALHNQAGRHADALAILSARKFQPWEGGEGQALGQHVRTHLALGRVALSKGNADKARGHFELALTSPPNLSEAKHLLANQSDIHYWLGVALDKLGDKTGAKRHWKTSAEFRGDFQEMSVRGFSEMTYYSALSLEKLGRKAAAAKMLRDLLDYARQLARTPAKIDYFATSLPTMLLFDDELQARQKTTARFLEAQACLGLGRKARARKLLEQVLAADPNHPLAADFAAGLISKEDV